MNKPHKWAALIKLWADGAEIEILWMSGEWKYTATPAWHPDVEYRIKPAPVYPKSTLTYNDLCSINQQASVVSMEQGNNEGIITIGLRLCADAAIAEFIESGEAEKWFESLKK